MPPAPSLPAWLPAAHHAVLAQVIDALASLDIPYVATGGLAGNLHGSAWPLHDIDLDVPGAALDAIAARFSGAVRVGPAAYHDAEFELDLLGLRFADVEVDISAAESIVLRRPDGERVPWPTDLRRAESRSVGRLSVRVIPLEALVAYKRILGRHADLRDLERLAPG